MAGLLSHSLAAMAACAVIGFIFGLPGISWGVFLAGFVSMLIELDLDDLSPNTRTPIGHSIFFGLIWIALFSLLVWGMAANGALSEGIALEFTICIISAYLTHLVIDSFTKEGIYTYPKGLKTRKWVVRLSKGDKKAWEYWHLLQNKRFVKLKRANDDPVLNAVISIPSLLAIIIFVALMPIPV
ncbi:MAG: metal-dependent hydrolase [Thermoplasmata archaeon]|nr:MAG: metal-dependent hydrolase [Thermoplasmata archaeon]